MAINLYDFHDIIRETYNEYVSRYEIDLVDFKNEYGTDSEPKFIEYQRVYLGKMRDYIIENLSKIDNEDLDSQFYHDKLQEALSDNKKMFQFLNFRLNPMNYISEQKENTSKDEYLEFFENLNNNKITESGMIKFIKSHESILELETLIRDTDKFIDNYTVGEVFNNWESFQFDEAYKSPLSKESFTTFKELVLSKIDELKNLEITSNKNPKNHYTENLWFKVGLLFAENKLEEYIEIKSNGELKLKDGFTVPKIAEKLGDKRFQKYILGSISNYSIDNKNADKNIFNDLVKMEKIIKYCNDYKIEICDFFMYKYQKKQQQLK